MDTNRLGLVEIPAARERRLAEARRARRCAQAQAMKQVGAAEAIARAEQKRARRAERNKQLLETADA